MFIIFIIIFIEEIKRSSKLKEKLRMLLSIIKIIGTHFKIFNFYKA